jgi:integrase
VSVTLLKRTLPSGTTVLSLSIYLNQKRTFESLHLYLTNDKQKNKEILNLAEAIRAKRELEVHAEGHGLPHSGRRKQNVFVYATTVYQHKKPLTRRNYVNALEHLRKYAGDDLTFDQIDARFCEGFFAHLKTVLKPNSAGAYFAKFKTVLLSALEEGIIQTTPARHVIVRHAQTLPKFLTLEQVNALSTIPCGNQMVRNGFLFSCNTGMRFQDVQNLRWEQIETDSIRFTQRKTGREEALPLSPHAISILKEQRNQAGFKSGEPAVGHVFSFHRRSTVDKVLKHWGKRANLNIPLSFHKARHSFATIAHDQGVDIYTISSLLGHSNLSTTQIYARVTDPKKREAVKHMPAIG